jgi:hypothetical protein
MPLISVFHRSRCFGSTALDMAFLSQGAVSVFVVPSLSRSFDFASGYLLIKEAGGIVTDLDGKEIDMVEVNVDRATPLLASANEELHRKSLEILMKRGLNGHGSLDLSEVLIPVKKRGQKHPCPDCTFCQWCNDDKCRKCRPAIKDPLKKRNP